MYHKYSIHMAVSLQAETALLHSVPISRATATVCLSSKDSRFFFYLLDIYTLKNGVKVT